MNTISLFDTAGMFTAKSSGVYSVLLATRSRDTHFADLALFLKKPEAARMEVCRARAQSGYVSDTCSTLQHLDVGDQIYAEGEENGETSGSATCLQIFFLYWCYDSND